MHKHIINPRLARSTRTGNWEVAYSERVGGKTVGRRISTGSTDFSEAQAFLTGWLASEDKIDASITSPYIAILLDAYLKHVEINGKGDTQRTCIEHLRKGFTDTRLSDLTIAAQHRYRQKRGVSDATLRRELGTLRAALNYARKHGLVTKAALEDIDIELPRNSQARQTYLTKSQADDFLEHATNYAHGHERLPRITRFVWLALTTAARKQAICGLTWDRVDWDANTIDYREPGEQITNKRRVLVPISKRLRPMLELMYQQRINEYVLDSDAPIRSQWERWIAGTPYPHITPHDCRRSWATIAAQSGVPIVTIAAILGDSIAITQAHYAHHVPGAAQAAIDVI